MRPHLFGRRSNHKAGNRCCAGGGFSEIEESTRHGPLALRPDEPFDAKLSLISRIRESFRSVAADRGASFHSAD